MVLVGILVSVACAPALFFFVTYLFTKAAQRQIDELKFRQMAKQDDNAALLFQKASGKLESFILSTRRKKNTQIRLYNIYQDELTAVMLRAVR